MDENSSLLDRALEALNSEGGIKAFDVTRRVHSQLDTPCIAGIFKGNPSRGEGRAFFILLKNPVDAHDLDYEMLKSWRDLHAFYGFADSPEYAIAVAKGQEQWPPPPR